MCIKGCDRPDKSRGLCAPHYHRTVVGLPLDTPLRPRRGCSYERMSRPVSYDSAHARCKIWWGKAGNYPCVKCGKKAKDWAYDGTDPTELVGYVQRWGRQYDGIPMRYSLWIEYYMPLCRACHAEFDHPGEVTVKEGWE